MNVSLNIHPSCAAKKKKKIASINCHILMRYVFNTTSLLPQVSTQTAIL